MLRLLLFWGLARACFAGTIIDMSQWMGQLQLGPVLLQDVLLPGSHNAGAYKILDSLEESCGSSDLAGISEDTLERLLDLERSGSLNLVQTQRVSIGRQLELGVRHLDLRLGWFRQDVYLHHTLFMDVTLRQVLEETADFLRQHSTEVVVMKMRLQCGAPLPVALELVESVLGESLYGGVLTPEVLSSPVSQVQGLVYLVWDETDGETALQITNAVALGEDNNMRSVQPDEYYRTYPCEAEDVIATTSRGAARNTCSSWPDYTMNQGQRLHSAIAADSALSAGTQLADWKPFTTSDSFRILSYIGILPLGKGCDPTSTISLGMAILTCVRIGIDSYTETFQERFLETLATLQTNLLTDAMNVIQFDYVDGFSLEAIVRLNGGPPPAEDPETAINIGPDPLASSVGSVSVSLPSTAVAAPPANASSMPPLHAPTYLNTVCGNWQELGISAHYLCDEVCQEAECCWNLNNNNTVPCATNPNCQGYEICAKVFLSNNSAVAPSSNETITEGIGGDGYTYEEVIFDACKNHGKSSVVNLCDLVCEGSECCFDENDGACTVDCQQYRPCSILHTNATVSVVDQACNNTDDLSDCVAACGVASCCFTREVTEICEVSNPSIICSRYQACAKLYG